MNIFDLRQQLIRNYSSYVKRLASISYTRTIGTGWLEASWKYLF